MNKLPKKFRCEENSHHWWEWTTAGGKKYGRCQRCGVVQLLFDPNPPSSPRSKPDAAVAKILGYSHS